ncbi:MAG: CHAD domain-containing protein [Actinomycetota bacterium]|nr:CHAD domain-containing protein [Actinomycetota bacterium]
MTTLTDRPVVPARAVDDGPHPEPLGPEDVHKTRVATRRLRAQVRTLRPVLARPWVDHVNGEMKWFAAALGEVRDADVLHEELEGHLATLPEADSTAARALVARLLIERESANARLLAVLESDRFRVLVDQLVASAADPPLRADDPRARAPAASVLPALVAKRWKRLRRTVKELGEDPANNRREWPDAWKQARTKRVRRWLGGSSFSSPD